MLLTLVLNWLLAHQLGAKEYGIFTYAFSWVYFFGTLSVLGLDSVLQRELVKYLPEKAIGLISFVQKLNVFITLSILVVFALIVYFFVSITAPHLILPLLLAVVALPFYSQILINKSVCVGFKAVEKSLIPENIIRPLILTTLLIVGFIYQLELDVKNAILFNLIAFFIAYLSSIFFTRKSIPNKSNKKIKNANKEWVKLGLTFFLLTVTITINSKADILMLGFFGHTDKVGIYNIAVKLSTFIALPLIIINRILTPFISEFFESKKEELSKVIKKTIRAIFLIGTILLIVFIFLGSPLLGYFGHKFKIGYSALILLSIGQLINLFVGPVGNALTMSKYEKLAFKSMIISTVLNIVLNFVLIPLYNIEGAAIATFVSLVYWNISLFFLVKKNLKMNLSII